MLAIAVGTDAESEREKDDGMWRGHCMFCRMACSKIPQTRVMHSFAFVRIRGRVALITRGSCGCQRVAVQRKLV